MTNTENLANPLSTSSLYRADIDGLRAVAVSLVVIFHAFPEIKCGGFIGVDVFFVISGFLITGIIVKDLGHARFSFKSFYARRIKRIYPALLVVLSVCYAAGWWLLLPEEFANLGKHMAGGAGFVANFVFWSESGYFDIQTELKPMLHLWSLGVEEQFYFIWPLLLFLAYRKHIGLLYFLPAIFLASFVLNIYRVGDDPVGTFYFPQTRFWELMTGALLAYWPRSEFWRSHSLNSKLADYLKNMTWLNNASACLGIILLIAAVVLLDKDSAFPGWWAVLPTLGTALMIAAGPNAWLNRTLLAHPLMVIIGLISYPLYLWHWPLLAFAKIINIGKTPVEIRAILALTSVLLAWLTYRFVELPLRFGSNQSNRTFLLSMLMALTFTIALGTFLAGGLPFRMPDKANYDKFFSHLQYTKSHDLLKHDRHECNFYDIIEKVPKATIAASCVTPQSKRTVFLWGDSHAQHLNYGLSAILPADVSLLQAGSSGCPPSAADISPDPLQTCNRANRFIWDRLVDLKPDVVILAQGRGHRAKRYDAVIARLKKIDVKTVLLVGPVPQWNSYLYKIILREYWQHTRNRLKVYLDKGVFRTDKMFKARYKNADYVRYVSLIDGLCNVQGCLTYLNNDRKEGLITYDNGHFTLPASEYVVRTILGPALNQALSRRKGAILNGPSRGDKTFAAESGGV